MTKRALLSVSDKNGIVDFAQQLLDSNFEILSTGGTLKALEEAGIAVTPVDDITKFPECFSGRVKTLHPMIHGGLLFRRDDPDHQAQAQELGVEPIDLVCVNLYPFEQTVAKGITGDDLIEQIDIGGPSMLRSAAKNYKSVTVVCDTADYQEVKSQLKENDDTTVELRMKLATKVFLRTAAYDCAITQALSEQENMGIALCNQLELRYGENPHQSGAYYDIYGNKRPWTIVQEEKKMSYLNILDADGAWNLITEFNEPSAACIKHANPCGTATASTIEEAFQKSYDADRLSAFGVIVALNKPCTEGIIQKIIDQKIFTEVIIAPDFTVEARELLKKRPKLRAIQMDPSAAKQSRSVRTMLGGILVQDIDTKVITRDDLQVATDIAPTDAQINDLLFAWNVVKHAKSNAIVFAKNLVTVGIGCGQTSRVDSTIIAVRRAGERAKGAAMASDAFFPFSDSIEEAAKNGISSIIQPGGSIRDEEVIAKANELGIPMVFTSTRGFKH